MTLHADVPLMPADPALDPQIRRFEEQYAENPESFVFARLADAYRKSGRPERALSLLEEGLSLHPAYLSARIVHARTLRDLGRTEEAVAAFGRVLELDAQNLVAVRGLAELARRRPDLEEVRSWLGRLQEMESLDEEVRRVLESVPALQPPTSPEEEGEGSAPDAAPDAPQDAAPSAAPVDEAAEEPAGSPPVPEDREGEDREDEEGFATATLAELYLTQGLHSEAVRMYERLLRRRPDDPELTRALERARRVATGGSPEPAADADGEPATAGGAGTASGSGDDPEERAEASGLTIREYLVRLLEGAAPAASVLGDGSATRGADDGDPEAGRASWPTGT